MKSATASISFALVLATGSATALAAAPRVFDLTGPELRAEVWAGPQVRAVSPLRFRDDVDLRSPAFDVLEIDLPEGAYLAVRTISERDGASGWTGKMLLPDGSLGGDVILARRGPALSGLVYAPDLSEAYEIRSALGGGHELVRLDHGAFPDCAGSPEPPGVRRPVGLDSPAPEAKAAPLINVLIVYSKAARLAAGGTAQIEALAQAAVDSANAAYKNSKIKARQALVGTAEVKKFSKDADFLGALNWVTANKPTATARSAVKADLVGFIIEGPSPLQGTCGIGWLGVAAGFKYGFSVSARTCAIGNLTFAHESGHNLGLHHNPEDVSGTGPTLPYAFGHFIAGVWHTVMAYNRLCLPCTKIPNFSNPTVSVLGFPTGTTARYNAKAANANAGTVSKFMN